MSIVDVVFEIIGVWFVVACVLGLACTSAINRAKRNFRKSHAANYRRWTQEWKQIEDNMV
jgi:hypothetical protein